MAARRSFPVGSRRIYPGTAHIVFHPPIDPADYATRDELSDAVRAAIALRRCPNGCGAERSRPTAESSRCIRRSAASWTCGWLRRALRTARCARESARPRLAVRRHRIAALAQRTHQHVRIFRVRHCGNLHHHAEPRQGRMHWVAAAACGALAGQLRGAGRTCVWRCPCAGAGRRWFARAAPAAVCPGTSLAGAGGVPPPSSGGAAGHLRGRRRLGNGTVALQRLLIGSGGLRCGLRCGLRSRGVRMAHRVSQPEEQPAQSAPGRRQMPSRRPSRA